MSIEKVREYFRGSGMEERIREFPVSSATVELARCSSGFAAWADACKGWRPEEREESVC